MKALDHADYSHSPAVTVSVVLIAAFLSACSNNSSGSSSITPEGTSEGIAYDGYLVNALVCIDRDLDKVCDPAEPSDTTAAGGAFELNDLTDAELLWPLVLETTNDTVDEDDGSNVGAGLKLTAPAGSQAISALSTIIQSRIETALAQGSTGTLATLKQQANLQLAQELGAGNINLTNYDPIATKTSGLADNVTRELAAKLHIVNQILIDQIAFLKPRAESRAPNNPRAAYGAVIKKLNAESVKARVDISLDVFAIEDRITATKDQIVGVLMPADPTIAEINLQADEDEAAEAAIRSRVNDDATGGTGTGGGTGTQ
ncbi:hypothetical protein [Marinobacter sp. SS21]|uniref:hypothetical protein n=1 Tax=Marinobacter sp. SS21 TaxID=2979460 RepID=UPI0023308841|nr:hypothetical protein [Marinobacter sp. SS21]MDC0661791.1 hypothetical protein [Marinobacter sp. SS21]